MSSKAKKVAKDIEKEQFKNLCEEIHNVKTNMIDNVNFTTELVRHIALCRFLSVKGCTLDELKNNESHRIEFENMVSEIMNSEELFDNFIDTITDEEIDLVKSLSVDN